MEHALNWVQALPRALRLHHDMVGVGGLSPYQVMFGRNRNLQGIPYTPERVCEDAMQFFDRMELVDQRVQQALQDKHEEDTTRINQGKQAREDYHLGDLVWVLKPASLSTQAKVEPRWRGPLQILQKQGHHSYLLRDKKGDTLAAHVDQLKPYLTLGEEGELAGLEHTGKDIEQVRGCKVGPTGSREFLVWWKGEPSSEATWVPYTELVREGLGHHVQQYIQTILVTPSPLFSPDCFHCRPAATLPVLPVLPILCGFGWLWGHFSKHKGTKNNKKHCSDAYCAKVVPVAPLWACCAFYAILYILWIFCILCKHDASGTFVGFLGGNCKSWASL